MLIKTEKPQGRVRNRGLKDYTGTRFGRLVALRLLERDAGKDNNHVWLFRCDCGAEKSVGIKYVRGGAAQSCGCIAAEALVSRNTTHGLTRTHKAEYRSWKDMRARCMNPNNADFADYGGRGIKVTERWADFAAFVDDMGRRPEGCTLDRIDVNGNYEPTNCRWADASVQANNKRSNRKMEMSGETKTLQDWCRQFGTDHSKVRYRLSRGMSLRDALTLGDQRSRGCDRHRDG